VSITSIAAGMRNTVSRNARSSGRMVAMSPASLLLLLVSITSIAAGMRNTVSRNARSSGRMVAKSPASLLLLVSINGTAAGMRALGDLAHAQHATHSSGMVGRDTPNVGCCNQLVCGMREVGSAVQAVHSTSLLGLAGV